MKRIMIVEDSETIRNVIKNALVSEFETREASDGVEALSAIQNADPIHLFLLDVNMPNMDGLELLKRIRAMPSHAATPVLMLTTETKEEFRAKAKEDGASGWGVKPFEPEKLLAVVRRLLA